MKHTFSFSFQVNIDKRKWDNVDVIYEYTNT